MKKVKSTIKTIIILIIITSIAILANIYLGSNHWDKRFASELDRFFGEGNWECVSSETKESMMYEEYHSSRNGYGDTSVPGKYKNWYISVTNESGEQELWKITNHVFKLNHDEYGWLSFKSFSNKQAFIRELFDIACIYAGEEVRDDILGSVLSEEEAACFRVQIFYEGGNPKPKFYNQLWEEEWFTAELLTAGDFLSSDLYDFYIDILLFDYKFEKLSEEEQEHVLNSFEEIQNMLLLKYGEYASFDMCFDEAHRVQYRNGEKVIK